MNTEQLLIPLHEKLESLYKAGVIPTKDLVDFKSIIGVLEGKIELFRQSDMTLDALKEAGVDNWEGYDYAMEILNQKEEEEKEALRTRY